MPLSPGQILNNRYRIVKLIGQGGFGAVYRAWDTSLNLPCAVKENLDTSAEAQRQFFREATLLASLRHPNLPRVTDHFLIPGQGQYLVMDFIEGQSLADLVRTRGRPLAETEVLPWLNQVCEALAYLHGQSPPIIHRDIKPENIIITPQGQAMLVDFGISKVYDPVLRTSTGGRAVTPGFSPPEQYSGSTDRTDARSDVYALGATLFAVLTGVPPPDAIDRLTQGVVLPSLSALRPDLSPGLQQLVDGALVLSHTQRPASVADLKRLMSGKAGSAPVSPVALPQHTATSRPMWQDWRLRAGLAGIALLLVAAVVFVTTKNGGGPPATPMAVAQSNTVPVATPTVPESVGTAPVAASMTSAPAATKTPELSRSSPSATVPRPTITRTSTATWTTTATWTATATRTPPPTGTPTATRTPTLTWTPTRTATQTLAPGVPVPTLGPEAFNAVVVSTRPSDKTGLVVNIRFADGKPKRGSWVGVYRQKSDGSGSVSKGDRIVEGRTDDNGTVFFALAPDIYAVQLGDYAGYPWGNEYNYQVTAGQATVISVALGRLQITVVDADGKGIPGRWTGVYLQKTDISGNSFRADRIGEARTASTGGVTYDLTPGMYGVQIGDITGYSWGKELDHPVLPGQTTTIRVQLGRLSVAVRDAKGRGLGGKWVGMYLQKEDVTGNPIRGDRILEGRTDITGALAWDVTAGKYAVGIGDIFGARWGEELNHEIKPGQTTRILLTLGRLTVGLQDADGRAIAGRWVGLSLQKRDISGNIVKGDRFLEGRTSSTGQISWDVTAGRYVLEIENVGALLDVPVQAGFETVTDGRSVATSEILVTRPSRATTLDIPPPLKVSQQPSDKSGLRVNIRYADGAPKRGSWVGIYRQIADVSGNPIKGDRLAEGRTDDAGTVFFALPAGTYSVQLGDYAGYNWGNEYDYIVSPGQAIVLTVTLGKLQIGVIDPDGKGVGGVWTGVYLQRTDVSGYPIRADRIGEARTTDTGAITYDLTPGLYGVGIGDIVGYGWGEELNHAVLPGQTTRVFVRLGRLIVGVRDADGKGLGGKWVGVHLQRADLNGNPIFGDRILEGRTDNTGAIAWSMTAGKYAVAIGDVAGNIWGEPLNHEVVPGQTTSILLTLGRLTVGLKDANGKPLGNRWVGVYYQKRGPDGSVSKGDRFLEGRTDNTGIIRWDVTAGNYIVEVEGVGSLTDVPIESGKTTTTDGKTVNVK